MTVWESTIVAEAGRTLGSSRTLGAPATADPNGAANQVPILRSDTMVMLGGRAVAPILPLPRGAAVNEQFGVVYFLILSTWSCYQ